MNLPIAATPSSAPAPKATKTKQQTNVSSTNAVTKPAAQDKVITSTSDSSGALPSDDGRDELDRARLYLAGQGVPKNSWMASQFLWKAIGKQNSEAVLLLSDLYARGDGVPRSCEQARILLVSAAKKGSSAAAQKLRSIETSCR
jgi:TPR repeat protein